MNAQSEFLVIGVGNESRGDDGVGRAVARRLQSEAHGNLRVIESSGEGVGLIHAWRGASAVILIDAVQSGGAPGSVHCFSAHSYPMPLRFFRYSTHAFSIAEAVELARAIHQLPPQFIVYGIEGESFEAGIGLSPNVARAADSVAESVRHQIEKLREQLG